MDNNQVALVLEDLARQLQKMGGWPAMRRDYVIANDMSVASSYTAKLQVGAHSTID